MRTTNTIHTVTLAQMQLGLTQTVVDDKNTDVKLVKKHEPQSPIFMGLAKLV